MAISRQAKTETLASLAEKLGRTKALVFTHYQGLSVKEVTELRRQLRTESIDLLVAKKTLLRKALADSGYDAGLVDTLPGDVAVAFGYADEVTPAKLLATYGKTHPQVELLAGLIEGRSISAAEVKALAKLPSKTELLAQTVWVIKGPVTGLVNVLAGNIRGLVTVLNALKDRQPAAA